MKRALLAAAAAIVAAALLVAGTLLFLIRRNLPDLSSGRIPGLSARVSVAFDDRGVATVTAATVRDALRAQGFLTARERLFQLELQRRLARGELAELFGASLLPSDRIAPDARLRSRRRGGRPAPSGRGARRPRGARGRDQRVPRRAARPARPRVHASRPLAAALHRGRRARGSPPHVRGPVHVVAARPRAREARAGRSRRPPLRGRHDVAVRRPPRPRRRRLSWCLRSPTSAACRSPRWASAT